MSDITLGIIGGGQLGSMLAIAAKKLNVKTIIFSDDSDAPAQNFCNQFISGNYDDKQKVADFVNQFKPDCVYNLTGPSSVYNSLESPVNTSLEMTTNFMNLILLEKLN